MKEFLFYILNHYGLHYGEKFIDCSISTWYNIKISLIFNLNLTLYKIKHKNINNSIKLNNSVTNIVISHINGSWYNNNFYSITIYVLYAFCVSIIKNDTIIGLLFSLSLHIQHFKSIIERLYPLYLYDWPTIQWKCSKLFQMFANG